MSGPEAKMFRYEPIKSERPKKIVRLCRTDRLIAQVQILTSGGENNLHSHTSLDGFWMVLKGRVRFYTTDDAVLGEFGPMEGVLVPRGYPYWFESAGEETLELLQIEGSTRPLGGSREETSDRVNYTPLRPGVNPAEVEIVEAGLPSEPSAR